MGIDGNSIRAWADCWVSKVPLMELLSILFALKKKKDFLVVGRFIVEGGV